MPTLSIDQDFGDFTLPADAPMALYEFLDMARAELREELWLTSQEWADLRKVRDQLAGGWRALQEKYHPGPPGLSAQLQERMRRMLKHVNLVKPALNLLTNTIHSGRIVRKATDAGVRKWVGKRCHARAMKNLARNAFAYGTGYLVPVPYGDAVRYWLPDPLWTILVTDPLDINCIVGVVQKVRDVADTKTIGLRVVTDRLWGTVTYGGVVGGVKQDAKVDVVPHGFDLAPVVVAYGEDRRPQGMRRGGSLVLEAADGSIKLTNNSLQIEVLRDQDTQAIMAVFGQPTNASPETRETVRKMMQFKDKESGDMKFVTPDAMLEDVIKVSDRICVDTSISTELPLDRFSPDMVKGSDASAASARIRAFPLEQGMKTRIQDWESVEEEAIGLVALVLKPGAGAGAGDLEEVAERVGATCRVYPSLPESEQETIANWVSKVTNGFSPMSEAVAFFSGHLTEEEQAALVDEWEEKQDAGEVVKAVKGSGAAGQGEDGGDVEAGDMDSEAAAGDPVDKSKGKVPAGEA